MAAPTTEMPGTITTTGEANGLLKTLRGRSPQTLLALGFSGTFVTAVVAVKGRLAGGTVFYPLYGWTVAGTPAGDSAALAPPDSTPTRYVFDVTGMDAVEVYGVSGTLTALDVEGVERAGPGQPVVSTTVGTTLSIPSAGSINDAAGNEIIKTPSTVASAVNELTVSNAATTASPSIAATGGDTNVSAKLAGKGTGVVERTAIDGLGGCGKVVASTITTAGAATYTAAQLKGGLLLRDPNGASRSDITPTGTLLVAALPGVADGAGFEFVIKNDADAAEVITVTAGTDCTLVGDMAIGQNELKRFILIVTSVASHTYTLYGCGSVAHNT